MSLIVTLHTTAALALLRTAALLCSRAADRTRLTLISANLTAARRGEVSRPPPSTRAAEGAALMEAGEHSAERPLRSESVLMRGP